MNQIVITLIIIISLIKNLYAENNISSADNLFHIGKMNSHNNSFTLYFKTREKAILARGEDFNYIFLSKKPS